MKFSLLIMLVSCQSILSAQYYFTDIVATKQSEEQYALLINNKVKQVKGISYSPSGDITEGFSIEQLITESGKKITTKTTMPNSSPFELTNLYENGLLIKSISTSFKEQTSVETINIYQHSATGSLQSIITNSNDTAVSKTNNNETHLWFYDASNVPTKMHKIKAGTDTTLVKFEKDEKGNIIQEQWLKKGNLLETYYYYYNERNQLTDVVRYNKQVKKLLPDFVYEYNAEGKMEKMIQSVSGGGDYLSWWYAYNENGLKQSETCYNRKKQILGRVEYEYTIGN